MVVGATAGKVNEIWWSFAIEDGQNSMAAGGNLHQNSVNK